MMRRCTAAATLVALAVAAAPPVSAGPLDEEPPVVSFASTEGPAASIWVSFNEPAGPVSAENLLIEHADGAAAAVIRGCRDGNGATVGCGGTLARAVRVDAVTPYPLGDHLTVVVNPEGVAAPIADAAGNPVAMTTHAQAIASGQSERGSALTFRWPLVGSPGAAGGSFRVASRAGMRATYAFTGDRVAWITRTGPKDGLAEVRVDGELVRRVDLSAASTSLKVRKGFAGFGAGAHTITVTSLGRTGTRGRGVATVVDGFTDVRGWVSQERAVFRWPQTRWPGASNRIVAIDQKGARFAIAFWGGGIDLRVPVGPGFGIAGIFIDGNPRGSFDLYRSTSGVERRSITGLSAGVHELLVTVTGQRDARSSGRRIGLDHVDTAAPIGMFGGLGAWVDLFDYGPPTSLTEVQSMLDTMVEHGVRTVYLQTARYNSDGPFVYPARIRTWLREAHARDLFVVGWYFPAFSQYVDVDVQRMIAAATYRSADGERFDAVGLDIEFRAETSGPDEFNAGIVEEMTRIRRRLGVTYPISAIAPPPNQMELAPSSWRDFPWPALGRLSDVIQPMAYSSYRKGSQCPDQPRYCTRLYTRNAVTTIRAETGMPRIPIHVIGGIADLLTRAEISDFVDGAEAARAFGASMYDHRTMMKDPVKYDRLEAFTGVAP